MIFDTIGFQWSRPMITDFEYLSQMNLFRRRLRVLFYPAGKLPG
uniref:Uncharacterized protein n=1 Tax=Utricularia reniformis TaxID=192314 RepID=A0A1Y0B0L6_9LAMI|nr:hypothetical protein AEK19_MT0695 [Utricularia reniformis]ART30943.1 hypothetical protein AEK19_MT0695 [Utricularia reniformis]